MRTRDLVLLPILLWPSVLLAQIGASPPCRKDPVPRYAVPGTKPNVIIWRADGSGNAFPSFQCGNLRVGAFKLVVALSGSFHGSGSLDELLSRFGKISELRGIRYWSITDTEWRLLFLDASALDGPSVDKRRKDFSVEEMKSGRVLYFLQTETRLSMPVVYRMQVLQYEANRLIVRTENVTSIRLALIPIAAPGEAQAIYFLEQRATGVWGYYGLALSVTGDRLFARVRDESLINRAAAFYRYISGVPTDRESPQAP